MKRILVSALLVAVLGVVGSGFAVAQAQDKMAQAVPADTLFYFGGTRDSAFTKLTAPLRESGLASILDYFATDLDGAQDYGQALRFAEGFTQAYANRVEQGKFIPGVPEAAQLSVYTVGLVPVVRLQLSDAEAFTQFLDTAEQLGNAKATPGQFKDITFREYSVGAATEQVPAQLLVAVRPNYVVFTLDAPMFRDTVLPLALGLQQPDTALPQNGAVQDIVMTNGFNYQNFAFINHQAIVAALTGVKDSLAGHMLDTFGADKELALLRNPACSADVREIFANWPVTALGMTERQVEDDTGRVSQRIVSRVTDSSLMELLTKLRGHVPAALLNGERQPMFNVALALNMDNLATTVMQLQQRFIEADFQCPPLQQAQQQLQKNDPSTYLIPFSAMVKGVQGISLSVFDANPDMENAARGLDAMVVISAEHPRMLFKMAKMFAPDAMKTAQLPSDGSPVELMPAQDGKPAVNAMLADKHLVLFVGSEALDAAQNLQGDKLTTNGILFARFDYGDLMDLIQKMLPTASAFIDGADSDAVIDEMQQKMKALDSVELRIDSLVDFVQQGVVVNMDTKLAVDDEAAQAEAAAEPE